MLIENTPYKQQNNSIPKQETEKSNHLLDALGAGKHLSRRKNISEIVRSVRKKRDNWS